jgi:hypothetical protein
MIVEMLHVEQMLLLPNWGTQLKWYNQQISIWRGGPAVWRGGLSANGKILRVEAYLLRLKWKNYSWAYMLKKDAECWNYKKLSDVK